MKRVKKVGNSFTLESAARADETDLLCDQCGNEDCSLRVIINRVRINRFNAKLAVIKCQSFMPILVFRDAAGLGSEFNTFRLSGAWAKRLDPGDIVALHVAKGQTIGLAEVIAVRAGCFTEMSAEFGADNHLAIDAEVNGLEFDLGKVMAECYGGHRFNTSSTVSVIDLRRTDGVSEEGEAHLRRVP